MENKKEIIARAYVVYIGVFLFAVAIIWKIVNIQFVEGEKWKLKAEQMNRKEFEIAAMRGNIYDINGNLLATSLPYYEIAMDVSAPSITNEDFEKYVDSLSIRMANLFNEPGKDRRFYSKLLRTARRTEDRYVVLHRNVSQKQFKEIKTFPLLRRGARGGLVYIQTNKREHPYKILAARTIGFEGREEDKIKGVGIEAAYDSILKGTVGKRMMQKIAGNVWRPLNTDNEIEPQDGCELVSTIDIRVQNVAEQALMKQLITNKASHGCVILMEVKTGEIRAIANLKRKDSTTYQESYNFAIGDATEPGSTFKLASLLAAMDDGYVDLDDKINVGSGTCYYYDQKMEDSHAPASSVLTVQNIFETSSNVGVSKIITKYYSGNPQKYLNRLYSYKLNDKLGINLPGEGKPKIKKAGTSEWYGTSLPWISIGYESLITPMHTLTLYNAVANNGKMVKPSFIREIRRKGSLLKRFEPEVINEQIAKPEVIAMAKKMCEGVVLRGTGKSLAIPAFPVAGKTGTAQISVNGKSYGIDGNRTYQASFVGYFPADKPLYTCIVIINAPSSGLYYGGAVAGPVFKEIAEKVYSTSIDFHNEINSGKKILTQKPSILKGQADEIKYVMKNLNIPYKENGYLSNQDYVQDNGKDSSKIYLQTNNTQKTLQMGIVPDLKGMSLRDALYLLENNGLSVKVIGFGKIKSQSISAGTKFSRGTQIVLQLG
ncbi:MAG: penicillin-binding protein [Bacteroidota bacterium]|jgi:cell division protein FtsI (penicillin-binding protein 3)